MDAAPIARAGVERGDVSGLRIRSQIRIVDDWLRSPASPPSHYRSVMVIAEKWAEQRVLMRAYAQSRDQTMPTIMLIRAP